MGEGYGEKKSVHMYLMDCGVEVVTTRQSKH